jgi:hypothetical protein
MIHGSEYDKVEFFNVPTGLYMFMTAERNETILLYSQLVSPPHVYDTPRKTLGQSFKHHTTLRPPPQTTYIGRGIAH